MPKPVMAALRDANWYANPNTRTPKRYHVVAQPAVRPCCCVSPWKPNVWP